MATKKYMSLNGMSTYTENLKNTFATKESVSVIEEDMDTYVLDVNYSILEFNTDVLITTSMVGESYIGTMVLGT